MKNQQKTNLKVDTTYNIESKNNKYKKYNKNNIINKNINNYNIPQTKEEESDRETGKPFKENGCRYGTHL